MRRHPDPRAVQSWDAGSGAPRVLIEEADGAMAWAMSNHLRDAGYQVVTCDGPDPRHRIECPLVRGDGCEAARTADVIVCDLHTCDGAKEVILALRSHAPATPILRGFPVGMPAADDPTYVGVTALALPYRADDLVDAVVDAVGQATGTG